MSTTLTYGLKNPVNGDRGSVWFPDMNSNIVQLDAHTHDGVTSAPIASKNVTKGSVTVSSGGSWTANGTGSYYQDKTCPTGYTMDAASIQVHLSSGDIIYPTIERLTSTTFRIYSLDSTLAYTVLFT